MRTLLVERRKYSIPKLERFIVGSSKKGEASESDHQRGEVQSHEAAN